MPTPIETAVDTYIKVWSERDPVLRRAMIESCFAADGRIVTRSREIAGPAAFDEAAARSLADPNFLRIRVTSAIDACRTTFRFRGVVDRRDGTSAESFDAGEVDASGRISVLLTFAGPLRDGPSDGPSDAPSDAPRQPDH